MKQQRAGMMRSLAAALGIGALVISTAQVTAAPSIEFSSVPLFLAPSVTPNLMVILDNSQSMDATMAGAVIAGDNEDTRSNTARRVLRKILGTPLADGFNWGLTSFETVNQSESNPPTRLLTNAYWLGNANTMVYTNTCSAEGESNIAGPGPNGKLRCTSNPEPGNGFNFITYEVAGDDASVNDVIYTSRTNAFRYVITDSNGDYVWYPSHRNSDTNARWSAADFSGSPTAFNLSRTDTGFGPQPSQYSRVLLKARAWGYLEEVTGKGRVLEPVRPLSATVTSTTNQRDTLLKNLVYETDNPGSSEIKNAALFTPLAGSLNTVRDYFRRGISENRKSPISHVCQKNFVILATDGNPTADEDGNAYSTSDLTPDASGWNKAQKDVFGRIDQLRNVILSSSGDLTTPSLAGQSFDVKTFVVGMGKSLENPVSVAALNEMARRGSLDSVDNTSTPASFGSDESSLARAFEDILGGNSVIPRGSSAVAVNSSAYRTGTAIFQSRFKARNWSGNLMSFAADVDGKIDSTTGWGAGKGAAARVKDQNWDTGRKIITTKASTGVGVPFRWPANPASPGTDEIDSAQAAAINLGANGSADGQGALRLRYLRGDATNEQGASCASCPFRKREDGPLGDIVNSAPIYVGPPSFGYANDFESASYGAFAAAKKDRRRVVYVGANDGMLHAFDAGSPTDDVGTGDELLGFVPAAVYANLSELSRPNYVHRYFVDGSPTVGDVFYNSAWRTILVSGMRSGAKGLFALDVTDPGLFGNEANASAIVRWEFQDSADMGHVYGQPLLVKTNNGRWSVIVGNGYGSSSGRAVLFIIDVETRAVTKLDTGSGTNNGLSAPTAIDTNGDGIVDLVYAGDLNGNLWKFDLSAAVKTSWAVGNAGNALFTAVTSGVAKPITSAPDVTRFPRGGYLVAFGTGRFFATGDNANTDAQAVYAIWDKLVNGTVTLSDLQQQQIVDTTTRGTTSFRLSTHAVGPPADPTLADTLDNTLVGGRETYLTTKRGWYLNLPLSGERVVSDVAFRSGRLIVVSIVPSTSCKDPDGQSWLMEFDAITGNRLDVLTFDINDDNKLTRGVASAGGDYLVFSTRGATGGNNVTGQGIGGIASGQTTIGKGSSLEERVFSTSDGDLEKVRAGRGLGANGRAMWREIR